MINYNEELMSRKVQDDYSELLKEAYEDFASDNVRILGEGFSEILSENSLFDSYVAKLTNGLDANNAEQVGTLMENARTHILKESGIYGLSPVASLSLPVIRKIWMRIALVNAIPTEAVKVPNFWISFEKPYLKDSSGNKYFLPWAMKKTDPSGKFNPLTLRHTKYNFPRIPIAMSDCSDADGFNLYGMSGVPSGTGKANNDSVDPDFFIDGVKFVFADTDTAVTGAITTADGFTASALDAGGITALNDLEYACSVKLDVNENLYGEIKVRVPRTVTKGAENKIHYVEFVDHVFGHVMREDGILIAKSLKGKISHILLSARLSSENNKNVYSVGFDVEKREFTIGTGDHINADLPIEWLQDTMAMYKIDGAVEVVDMMSRVVAQQLELEIYDYLLKVAAETASNPDLVCYNTWFDCRPSAGFALTPKEWLNELRRVFDYQAIKMKNDSNLNEGYFVILGNPLDTQLLPNVNWVFDSSSSQKGGVNVSYNLGAFSGINRYEVVSSENLPQGEFVMFFVPTGSSRQISFRYYPYTFNVEKNYLNPNNLLVPSIMMTKRHLVTHVLPMICKITIKNNNGLVMGSGTSPYWS